MFLILLILFTVVPALEFYLLFKIGGTIGAGNTFLIIIGTGIVGAALAKAQGLSILNRISSTLSQGQLPASEIMHGFIVFGGGLLLLTPGFITDILGFCMVLPGTRHLIVVLLANYFERGIKSGNIKFFHMGQGGGFQSGGFSGGFYSSSTNFESNPFEPEQRNESIEGEVIEVDFEKKDS